MTAPVFPAPIAVVDGYLRQLADRIGLKDWIIAVDRGEPVLPGALASVCVVDGRKLAIVRLASGLAGCPAPEQRYVLVHELVHCHLDGTHRAIDAVKEVIGTAAFTLLEAQHRLAVELATDAVAEVLAPSLPLPPWCGSEAA